MPEIKDDSEVAYELAVSEDDKIYQLRIKCDVALSRNEYAVCLQSLAEDILAGRMIDILDGEEHSPLN